jgi:hypothetical protein
MDGSVDTDFRASLPDKAEILLSWHGPCYHSRFVWLA